MQLERIVNVKIILAIRGGNVNINIKEKFSWVNKNELHFIRLYMDLQSHFRSANYTLFIRRHNDFE